MMLPQYQTYKNSGIEELGKFALLILLKEVTAEILQLEQEIEGLLKGLVSFEDSVKI